jgi:hypothetical protein
MAVNNPTLPTVIQKSKTTTVGQARTITLKADMQRQTKADIQNWIRGIALAEVSEQTRAGNPPALITVDNKVGASISQAERKVVVVFGTTLVESAIRLVELELAAAIRRSTVTRSGKLSDIAGSWQWLRLGARGGARALRAGEPLTFSYGDALVLRPIPGTLPYAMTVNSLVAGGGKLKGIQKRKDRKEGKAPQSIGFMLTAIQRLRRRPEFREFQIKVTFSARGGESYQGKGLTPGILIRPRLRGRQR